MIKTRIPNYILKEATVDDIELIYNFIVELAEYEGIMDWFNATVEGLKESIFKRKEAEVLIAYYNEKPVGFCVFCKIFSTVLGQSYLYLDDLFVKEEYRKKGFGKEMLAQLGIICQQRDLKRIEWFCLDWNTPSLEFYEHVLKATPHPELRRFRWEPDAIRKVLEE